MHALKTHVSHLMTAHAWQKIGDSSYHGINLFLPALRSKHSCGIGEFLDLIPIIDWCHRLKIDCIQLLPLNDSESDQAPTIQYHRALSIQPIFLSHALPHLDKFPELHSKLKEFSELNTTKKIPYLEVFNLKISWLQTYYTHVKDKSLDSQKFKDFQIQNPWVEHYALFTTLTFHLKGTPITSWPKEFRTPSPKQLKSLLQLYHSDICFYMMLQYLSFTQLEEVKAHAHQKSILLMGDIPILVSKDSADVWLHPDFFDLNVQAGAPPDDYSKEGQNWSLPIYQWDAMRIKHFSWWKQRLKVAEQFFDVFRIDHVLGFFRIWAIPPGRHGSEGFYIPPDEKEWETQGKELLEMICKSTTMLPIAEDLGDVPPIVRTTLEQMGICGTKVLRWERKWEENAHRFIPIQNYSPFSLTCVSTHDSETLSLWWKNEEDEARAFATYKHWTYTPELTENQREAILWDSHHTSSLFHINLLQEYLAFFPELTWSHPEDERINIPGTVLPSNWTYRYRASVEEITTHSELFAKIQTILFSPNPPLTEHPMQSINLKILLILLSSIGTMQHLDAKKKVKIQERELPTKSKQLSLETLFNSLDPLSVSQHLAFYELYSDTQEGKKALRHAWDLLSKGSPLQAQNPTTLPALDIQAIISLVTRQSFDAPVRLNNEQLELIEKISAFLSNRTLKGSQVWTQKAILQLPPEEIDIARGLLLFQFDDHPHLKEEVRQYEASIDLMALQIAARLPDRATHEDKIRAINHFIFQEMQFRFPPHSLYAVDIDLYTFLPSVLDSRQGVCLGVSILYLSLAQRLDLPLEIITPPGHIYVRYNNGKKIINIETTARGIDLPSEQYLGINTRKLHQRTIKEVIGLAFMNQASVYWSKQDYAKTTPLYEKAALFISKDPLLKMFMGFNYLFVGRNSEGAALLREIRQITFDEAISAETIPDDYLSGRIDAEGIKAVFLPVDETRDSILQKQKELQQILKRYPSYRAGQLHLATTWLQLGRGSEAKEILESYHRLDTHSSIVEYYLAVLSMERLDYNRAWYYLLRAESLTAARNHHPKILLSLREALRRISPEP